MKHAYLIIAHNNWWQLKELLKKLDYEANDIYLHIDKKSNGYNLEDFNNAVSKSNIYIYSEYKVYWGSYSMIEAEMFLLEKAFEKKYDYYHIISGVDIPLVNNDTIYKFFYENAGLEFIEYDDEKLINDPEISRRTRLYHFLQDYRRKYKNKFANAFFTFIERCLLLLQICFRVNRVKNLDWTIKYGSNWVSITNELTSVVLDNKDKIRKVFSYTNCADELFVQTVAYNCGFKDKIYPSNMRFVDWKRGNNGNPYTFRLEDYDMLKASGCLFARKFSEGVDKDIILRLIENAAG